MGDDSAPSAKAKHTSDTELKAWMERRRDQCEVLESVPGAATADFRSGTHSQSRSTSSELACQERVIAALARNELRERLQQGPLAHSERMDIWSKLLGIDLTHSGVDSDSIPQALIDVLHPDSNDEEILFECEDGEKAKHSEDVNKLANAFCSRYLSSFSAGDAPERGSESFNFDALSQLLLYHYPQVAVAMRSAAIAETGVNDLAALLRSLCTSCGMEVRLRDLLFDTSHGGGSSEDFAEEHVDKTALLLFCDLVFVEDEDLLIPFAMVVLLSELSPEPGFAFAYLEEGLQQAITLSGLVGRGTSDVFSCVSRALSLICTTPQSLKSVLRRERTVAWLQSPICLVSPEEVLQHTHLGISSAWRLIVVDARMRTSEYSLPVCVRLAPARHSCRLEELQRLPQDDEVHLCLLGDGPPGRSDDALELCLGLVGKGSLWKHVSIVEGGWPAIERAAGSMSLELMPIEMHIAQESTPLGASMVEQVSVAKETASAAAQLALTGASRALSYLDERWGSSKEATESPAEQKQTQAVQAERQEEYVVGIATSALGYFGGLLKSRSDESEQTKEDGLVNAEPLASSTPGSRALSYLDGLWGGGKIQKQDELLPAESEVGGFPPVDGEVEGPKFSGIG